MSAEKLSITLPADMAQMVRRRVEAGAYASNSEVIREALRGWMDREQEREKRLEAIRVEIDRAANNPSALLRMRSGRNSPNSMTRRPKARINALKSRL